MVSLGFLVMMIVQVIENETAAQTGGSAPSPSGCVLDVANLTSVYGSSGEVSLTCKNGVLKLEP